MRAHRVHQCYYCNHFFISEIKQKRHVKNCSGKPGVIYNFNNQSLISYQENFRAKADLPIAIYFDFESLPRSRTEKNACSFLCYDCCFSSIIKT